MVYEWALAVVPAVLWWDHAPGPRAVWRVLYAAAWVALRELGDPRAGEIVVAIAVTDSGRPLPRIGGLQKHEIKGEDGLR